MTTTTLMKNLCRKNPNRWKEPFSLISGGDIDGESGLVLSNSQLDYINKMEAGWDDSYAGSLYVYIDPSPMFVQFENPVLLKIKHDDTGHRKRGCQRI